MALTIAALAAGFAVFGVARELRADEPLGVRPHYHGFHVGRRHADGWRYPSGRSYRYRVPTYEYHSYGWNAPYGYGTWSSGRIPLGYGYVYPPAIYSAPPVFVPPELHFGPQALDRFLGQDRNAGLRPPLAAPPAAALPQGALGGEAVGAERDEADEDLLRRPPVRRSNAQARARAGRFLTFGDQLFAEQRFHEALQRYKSAAQAAPDLAEPYFRQMHALVATNRFDLAADALRRALPLADDVTRGGFRLDELYERAELAKQSHLESLARQALEHPRDAELLLLLGVFLFHDGQPHRAKPFLDRAADLLGERAAYAQPYLDAITAEAADALDL